MKIATALIIVALISVFSATIYAQQTQQVFRVTRVYVDPNSLPSVQSARIRRRSIRQDGTAQTLQFYQRLCENTFPTLVNLNNRTGTGFCAALPLSLFAVPNSGNCDASSCSIYNNDIGGGLGGGFGPGQVPAPGSGSLPILSNETNDFVSITTYSNLQGTPGSASYIGQAATGQTVGIAYCPGSAGITSTFVFQSGACVLSPNVQGLASSDRTNNSLNIFSNYRAFYAICGENNGLIIKGCIDTNCQNCFVVTDTSGCVQYAPNPDLPGYINYQGCGIGRAEQRGTGGGGGGVTPTPPTNTTGGGGTPTTNTTTNGTTTDEGSTTSSADVGPSSKEENTETKTASTKEYSNIVNSNMDDILDDSVHDDESMQRRSDNAGKNSRVDTGSGP